MVVRSPSECSSNVDISGSRSRLLHARMTRLSIRHIANQSILHETLRKSTAAIIRRQLVAPRIIQIDLVTIRNLNPTRPIAKTLAIVAKHMETIVGIEFDFGIRPVDIQVTGMSSVEGIAFAETMTMGDDFAAGVVFIRDVEFRAI